MFRQLTQIATLAPLSILAACFDPPPARPDSDVVFVDVDAGLPVGSPGGPMFESARSFTATVPGLGRAVDVYAPVFSRTQRPSTLPVALLLQGALVEKQHYSTFAQVLASYGFVVAVAEGGRAFGVGPFIDLADVAPLLNWLRAEHARPESPLAGIVDADRVVLVGHSFGGAAALDAAQGVCRFPFCSQPPTWRDDVLGVAVYGTHLADPLARGAVPDVTNDVPVFMVAGDRDGIAGHGSVIKTFERVQHLPKGRLTVIGANHYSITNSDNLPETLDDPNAAALEQRVATQTIARWTAELLRAYALGDAEAYRFVTEIGPASDPNVELIVIE